MGQCRGGHVSLVDTSELLVLLKLESRFWTYILSAILVPVESPPPPLGFMLALDGLLRERQLREENGDDLIISLFDRLLGHT